MENQSKPVNFSLNRILTLQFATLEENFIKDGEIELTTAVNFSTSKDDHLVASKGTFTFSIEQKPFLKLEAACEFIFENVQF